MDPENNSNSPFHWRGNVYLLRNIFNVCIILNLFNLLSTICGRLYCTVRELRFSPIPYEICNDNNGSEL